MSIFKRKSSSRPEPEPEPQQSEPQDAQTRSRGASRAGASPAGATEGETTGTERTDQPSGRPATRSGARRAGASPAGGSCVAARPSGGARPATSPARESPRATAAATGPRDRGDVSEQDLDGLLDLGALLVQPLPDSELRLDVDEEGRTVTGVTAVVGDASVQLQAFAAPKSAGLWREIRGEIADNLLEAGGTAETHEGPLGTELHVRMPARGEGGRTTYTPVRFVGVDGPRWFLRAVLTGRAAVDDETAAALTEFVAATVVDRGSEARAPRELLELTLPQELAQQPADGEQQGDRDALQPFERGPEITEVR